MPHGTPVPFPGRSIVTGSRAYGRIALILEYEPSWFAEFMSAVGILAWSVLTFFTHDYRVNGWAYFLPCAGLLFGPSRVWLLFHLKPKPRVLAACAGTLWWGWLVYKLVVTNGALPGEGAFAALLVGDLLTLGKFNLAAMAAEREVRVHG